MGESSLASWVRICASAAGLISAAVAAGRAVAGTGLLTAVYESAGWLGAAYMGCAVIFMMRLAWRARRRRLLAAIYGLGALACAFSIFGWVAAVHQESDKIAGAIVGGVGFSGVAGYYAIDAAERRARSRKQCPDCCETIKAAARVCPFCGYRFNELAGP
jgi:Uncharacterised protein family UPF0547